MVRGFFLGIKESALKMESMEFPEFCWTVEIVPDRERNFEATKKINN
jgi:hypothetical protein